MSVSISPTLYVGLDVHKDAIAVATADYNRGEARLFGKIENTAAAVERLARRLAKAHPGRALVFATKPVPAAIRSPVCCADSITAAMSSRLR